MTPIRLLIADDHPIVRSGLSAMLSSEGDFLIIGAAENGSEACKLIASHEPDVALIDLRMPHGDGLFVLEYLKRKKPRTRGLVLTTYEDPSEFARAETLGARGYLLKDAPKEQLCHAIRQVHTGKRALAPRFQEQALPESAQPSPRELEVLGLLARGESNRTIARQLFISEATVKTHLLHLFDKLECSTRTEAVVEAIRRGWCSLKRP